MKKSGVKRFFTMLSVLCCIFSLTACQKEEEYDAKPVIYLYPEHKTDVTVKLDYTGNLTCTYPEYKNGWKVSAEPDGTLTDADGQTYNYLYWEGMNRTDYDFSEGFCVAGSDTAAFLEDALDQLGLTRQEANEFIVYWLPRMKDSAYNLIAFQTDAYTQTAELSIGSGTGYPAAGIYGMETIRERSGYSGADTYRSGTQWFHSGVVGRL